MSRGLELWDILVIMNTLFEGDRAMRRTTTMTVRLSGALSDHVSTNVGENGAYENISEYIRDLIRRDKERSEREAYERLKAELVRSFAARMPPIIRFRLPTYLPGHVPVRRMKAVRVQAAAALRIDEIYRYSRDRWGEARADAYNHRAVRCVRQNCRRRSTLASGSGGIRGGWLRLPV